MNEAILRKLSGRGFMFKFLEEDKALYPLLENGNTLTKMEARELIKALHNYIEITDDEVVTAHNNKPRELYDYNKHTFKLYEKKKKDGHVLLYKNLLTNTYKFSETKSIETQTKDLYKKDLELVFSIRYNNIRVLKQYLENIYSGSKNSKDWYNLSDNDLNYMTSNKFKETFETYLEDQTKKREVESFECNFCKQHIIDTMQESYYDCTHCNNFFSTYENKQKFCCYECFEKHYIIHHGYQSIR